jgi:YidC/Oxa1 family membrane protein insertase
MDQKFIIFLILSLAIIIGYDYVLRGLGILPPPAQTEAPSSQQPAPPDQSETAPTVKKEPAPPSPSTESSVRPPTPSTQAKTAPDEQLVDITNDRFHAVLTNKGAVLRDWELKPYSIEEKGERRPVEMVYRGGQFKNPLALELPDAALAGRLNEALYDIERDFTTLDATHPVGHVTFRHTDRDSGVRVTKELTFRFATYVVDIVLNVEGLKTPLDIALGTNFGIIEWGEGFIGLIGPASMIDGKIEKDAPDGEVVRTGSVGWLALQDKYFLSVLIPESASGAVLKKQADKVFSASVRYASPSSPIKMSLYAGPKEFDTLKSFNIGLEDTIDFGWFIYGSWGIVKAVAKPLFYVLRFLYEYTHNYGVAIVLLTVMIKLLFVPLQYKSYKSMKDMQLIQPKVVELQQKYKDDREKLNRELMRLYREHKVNPVGGCLPMLLQMPVFVALFNILYMTIDLRQAPFVLWVTDLSAPDPYYVLPILMGISMVVQQKIMPTTMDPTQAKIMLFLPAVMTVLFLSFPSGLVLYWLTNNVVTITQQFVTDRYVFKKPAPAAAAPGTESPDGGGDGQPSGKKKKARVEQESPT